MKIYYNTITKIKLRSKIIYIFSKIKYKSIDNLHFLRKKIFIHSFIKVNKI